MATLIVTVALSIEVTSCESNSSKENNCHKHNQYDIHTTRQWIDFVSQTSDISEIDKAYKSLKGDEVVVIFKELIDICVHTNTNEPKFDDYVNAFWYLNMGYRFNQKYGKKLAKKYANEMYRIVDKNNYDRTDYNNLLVGLVELNYMDNLKKTSLRYSEYMFSNDGK